METTQAQTATADLDALIAELVSSREGLPRETIRALQQHRELATPRLIALIEEVTAQYQPGEKGDGDAHFFALFLLAEFGAKEALPAIVESMSLPGEAPFDLYGDAVISFLGRTLATLAAEKLEVLDDLIRNPKINKYVRWEAAQAFQYLVRDESLEREEVVARLAGVLRELVANKDVEGTTGVVQVLTGFSPAEVLDDIKAAFLAGVVDECYIDLEEVEEAVAEPDVAWNRTIEMLDPTRIADTLEELEDWTCFQVRPAAPPEPSPLPVSPIKEPIQFPAPMSIHEPPPPVQPIRNTEPRVGRNDPCPCGSGKKYKKCCLSVK